MMSEGGKSQAAIIAAALERAKNAMEELRFLIRRLEELEQTTEKTKLTFRDSDLFVSWNGGATRFRKSGYLQYLALKAIAKAEDEKLSHAELAEILFGDELKDFGGLLYRLQSKLADNNCPKRLAFDKYSIWLAEI